MKDIIIEEEFHQELLKNIKTSLIHTGIEILEYYKKDGLEFLKLLFPFTTTGNILTYQYNKKTNELLLIDATVYSINEEKMNQYDELVDKTSIKNIYRYCRKQLKAAIDSINLEKIYDMIIDDQPLTKTSLINQGYTEESINLLLEENILKITDTKEYALSSIEKFYRYGVKLLLLKNVKRANTCFRICYKLEPTNREVCLQIFYMCIRLGEYTEAFSILQHIERIGTKENIPDNNLYLYMLSKLTGCPKEYIDKALHITTEDVLIPYNSKLKNKQKENYIRKTIIQNKYRYALNLLNDILATDILYNVKYALLKELLTHLINMEDKFKFNLLHITKTKKYGKIILFLNERTTKRKLNGSEKNIYLLAEDILDITRTKIIPSQTVTYTDSLQEAIEGKNYKLAQELNRNFLRVRRMPEENDILTILLADINELISRIQEGKVADILTVSTNQLNEDSNQTKKYAEDLAYYINSEKLTLEEATKIYSLNLEQVLLVKLIYVRDYYTEGLYHQGDILLEEVELCENKTPRVINLLNEIKENRMLYINTTRPHIRKRIQIQPNN